MFVAYQISMPSRWLIWISQVVINNLRSWNYYYGHAWVMYVAVAQLMYICKIVLRRSFSEYSCVSVQTFVWSDNFLKTFLFRMFLKSTQKFLNWNKLLPYMNFVIISENVIIIIVMVIMILTVMMRFIIIMMLMMMMKIEG